MHKTRKAVTRLTQSCLKHLKKNQYLKAAFMRKKMYIGECCMRMVRKWVIYCHGETQNPTLHLTFL